MVRVLALRLPDGERQERSRTYATATVRVAGVKVWARADATGWEFRPGLPEGVDPALVAARLDAVARLADGREDGE